MASAQACEWRAPNDAGQGGKAGSENPRHRGPHVHAVVVFPDATCAHDWWVQLPSGALVAFIQLASVSRWQQGGARARLLSGVGRTVAGCYQPCAHPLRRMASCHGIPIFVCRRKEGAVGWRGTNMRATAR
jgi:hypothetical protein